MKLYTLRLRTLACHPAASAHLSHPLTSPATRLYLTPAPDPCPMTPPRRTLWTSCCSPAPTPSSTSPAGRSTPTRSRYVRGRDSPALWVGPWILTPAHLPSLDLFPPLRGRREHLNPILRGAAGPEAQGQPRASWGCSTYDSLTDLSLCPYGSCRCLPGRLSCGGSWWATGWTSSSPWPFCREKPTPNPTGEGTCFICQSGRRLDVTE